MASRSHSLYVGVACAPFGFSSGNFRLAGDSPGTTKSAFQALVSILGDLSPTENCF
jgi:hypothetical protein